MKKYQIEVVETLSRIVEVDADNYEAAEELVEQMYQDEKIVLGYENHVSTEYKKISNLYDNKNNKLDDKKEFIENLTKAFDKMYHKELSDRIKRSMELKNKLEQQKKEEQER